MREPQEDFSPYEKLPEPHPAIERGDFHAALSAFATREMLAYREHGPSHSDVWVCGFGVTLWLMGDKEGAGSVWSKACDEAWRQAKQRTRSWVTLEYYLLEHEKNELDKRG